MRNNTLFIVLSLIGIVYWGTPAVSKEIVVSPDNMTPLESVETGDTVCFKGGRYREPIELDGLMGTAEKPITLATAPNASVVIDGTDPLPNLWKLVRPDSPEGKPFVGQFKGNRNVYSFESNLSPGQAVYWRVDAVRRDKVIKGNVWTFKVRQAAGPPATVELPLGR